MELIFFALMGLLPFQMLGAFAYHLSRRLGPRWANVLGLLTPAITLGLTLGGWVLWEANHLNPQGFEGLFLAVVVLFVLPIGIATNFICSLITLLIRRNATRLPALKPLQLS